MKHNQLNTNGLPVFTPGNCADPKVATAEVVKWLEERALLEPNSNKRFYAAFGKYQNGDVEITGFPFLMHLLGKGEERNSIPSGVLNVFIAAGADVNAKDRRGATPLHKACEKGYTETVKVLLAAGADVSARNECGRTPLHYASNGETARALIEAGACVNAKAEWSETPLHKASEKGRTETVRTLIAAGADVNAKTACGETPLHRASEKGRTETVRALIEAGADVNAKAEYGETPLLSARREKQMEVVSTLLAAGADEKDGEIDLTSLRNFRWDD